MNYWPELSSILDLAEGDPLGPRTLLGGLALAKRLRWKGNLPAKTLRRLSDEEPRSPGPVDGGRRRTLSCPQSRYAGFRQADVERAEREGTFKALAWSKETGTTLFRTPDFRFVGHIGHPEYPTERLALEYFRDKAKGLADVCGPVGYDPDHPLNTWGQAGVAFFRGWLRLLASLAEGSADEGERP